MARRIFVSCFLILVSNAIIAQLGVARDTISVVHQSHTLKMPWANGINFANVSSTDFNGDGKKDVLLYDKLTQYNVGTYRCFINVGQPGELKYRHEPNLRYFFPNTRDWSVMRQPPGSQQQYLFTCNNSDVSIYRSTTTNNVPSFQLVKKVVYSNYNPNGNPYMVDLYASSQGVPGIVDVDGDGDLDILTFSSSGYSIEFHKNLSKELYQHCDSFVYQLGYYCWGNFSENSCIVTFGDCTQRQIVAGPAAVKHAGSCLACLDNDSDGDQDLIMGDISCDIVHYVHNTGSPTSASFTDTTQLYPNFPAKANTKIIQLSSFPCAYVLDVDGDNKKDLVVTPNTSGSENYKSMWVYRDASSTPTANFQFVKENFLQDEMIDVGQMSFPVLFDYDADGLKDLLIGNYGYFVKATPTSYLSSQLTLYRNVGTKAQPSFSLVTNDYLALSSSKMSYAIPAVGDLDGDGDVDILLGSSTGQVHWLENTAGANQPCQFASIKLNPFNFTTPSAVAAPFIFDVDKDNLPDLLIGMKNGRIAYYRNTGTASLPAFSLTNSFFGNIDVKGDPNLFILEGYAVPFAYEDNGTQLLVGSIDGTIKHFSGIGNGANYTLLSSVTDGLNEGAMSTCWFDDINDDGKRDLFVGNAAGGLSYFSSKSGAVGIQSAERAKEFQVYPNPSSDLLSMDGLPPSAECAVIYAVSGIEVLRICNITNGATISVNSWPDGVYFVNILDAQGGVISKGKFIRQ